MGDILFFGGCIGMGVSFLLIVILIPVFRQQRKKLLKQMKEE